MVRLVAVADTHLFHQGWAVPEGDIFLHAGDLCRRGTAEELMDAAAWIRGLPHRHKVIVAGNHDFLFQEDPQAARSILGPELIYLEDKTAIVAGLRIHGSPWQPEFGGWAFNLPRGAPLAERWALIPEGLDVLITHSPPLGYGDTVHDDEHVGCADLLRRIREVKPRLHLFGHIHQDGGLWLDQGTSVVNVTAWEGERGATVIDVTPDRIIPVVIPPR